MPGRFYIKRELYDIYITSSYHNTRSVIILHSKHESYRMVIQAGVCCSFMLRQELLLKQQPSSKIAHIITPATNQNIREA